MNHDNITKNNEEYVYIMSNPSFLDDMFKIGWTREHPNIRALSLHTTGIPTPFKIEYVIVTSDGFELEKKIHEHFKNYRISHNREFFKIPKKTLTEILTKELFLTLTQITEIIASTNKNEIISKDINQIKKLVETLKKEFYEFFSKFNKEKSKLVICEINNKKYVTICNLNEEENHFNTKPLDIHGFEDYDEEYIKKTYLFIKRNISKYEYYLDDLDNNYVQIKQNIGIQTIKSDNKVFLEMVLNTHKYLNKLKNKYIWEL